MTDVFKISPSWLSNVKTVGRGILPTADNSSIGTDLAAFTAFQYLLRKSSVPGQLFNAAEQAVVSTYSLIYTNINGAHVGGVLAPNGDIHFVPYSATVGQKININGAVSTYSIITEAYLGGTLDPNGNRHFAPFLATVGQKISASGVVNNRITIT